MSNTKLGNPPAPHSRPYLDGIRAVAVVFIFIRHVWGLSGSPEIMIHVPGVHTFDVTPLIVMMQTGVDLFFVLSGFLLAKKWFVADFTHQPKPSLRYYARTRFWRIAPPYWISLPLMLAAGLYITPHLIPHSAVFSARGGASVAAHIGFLQTIFYPAYGSFGIATPYWTLSVEMVFYLVLPFLVRGFLRNRWLYSLPICLAIGSAQSSVDSGLIQIYAASAAL